MLKRILAFILILSHLNTSMFIPQMDEEVDVYDSAGNQVDDINTFIEYIDQDVLGQHDPTPEDEDDDTARPLHIIKIVDYTWHPYYEEAQTKASVTEEPDVVFTGYIEHKPAPGFSNIKLPPPKAC